MTTGGQIVGDPHLCTNRPGTVKANFPNAVPGVQYEIDWGDGSIDNAVQDNTQQVDPFGTVEYVMYFSHQYPASPVSCTYTVKVMATNACTPANAAVFQGDFYVWTPDLPLSNPPYLRVCQGIAAALPFLDVTTYNCFDPSIPLNARNSDPRWIQWIYDTGPASNRIPGVQVNGRIPSTVPYYNPANYDPIGGHNLPKYPQLSSGTEFSLPITIPATAPSQIGKEYWLTLRYWNKCNPYDNDLTNGALTPTSGNYNDGDDAPVTHDAKIYIVESPRPAFEVFANGHATDPSAVKRRTFCIGEEVFLDDQTPPISDPVTGPAYFYYTWEIYDGPKDSDPLLVRTPSSYFTNQYAYTFSTGGKKLIRLRVKDVNAIGSCEPTFDAIVDILDPFPANIEMLDNNGNVVPPTFAFCGNSFDFSFHDISTSTIAGRTLWRWERTSKVGATVTTTSYPSSGFSSTPLPYFNDPANPGSSILSFTEGEHSVRLILKDNSGISNCESYKEIKFFVVNQPTVDFDADPVCEGNTTLLVPHVSLVTSFQNPIDDYVWDFNYVGNTLTRDAVYRSPISVNQNFVAPGVYHVALSVSTGSGTCPPVTVAKDVVVNPKPNSAFTFPNNPLCGTSKVGFTNTSTIQNVSLNVPGDRIVQSIWEVDQFDGLGYQAVAASHDSITFMNNTTLSKIYNVRLRSVSDQGCIGVSPPSLITISPGAGAIGIESNYDAFATNCSPLNNIQFYADATTVALNPVNYDWEVSLNGTPLATASGRNSLFMPAPSPFNATSNSMFTDYSVKMTVTQANGCVNDVKTTVRVNPLPPADFTISALEQDCDQQKLMFETTTKGLVSYEWTEKLNGIVIYNGPGGETLPGNGGNFYPRTGANQTVEVTLKTTNFASCESPVVTHSFIIPMKQSILPAFTFSPGTPPIFPNSTYTFTHTNFDGTWTYTWDYGDGVQETTQQLQVSHAYALPGQYKVTLTASIGNCNYPSLPISVSVLPQTPVLDFSYNPASGCAPLKVSFTNLSQNIDPSSFTWDFGGGESPSYQLNPDHIFERPGPYSVTLSAKDFFGNPISVTKSLIIDVFDKPLAYFTVQPNLVYLPGKLYTINQSIGGSEFLWNFGDGTTSSEFDPSHEYKEEGLYEIKLIAKNSTNCVDSITLSSGVRVLYGGEILAPNAFVPSPIGPGNGSPDRNDVFLPIMRGVQDYQLQIFNRWGQLVFESFDANKGWDGYFNGILCPSDVYAYKLVVKLTTGRVVTRVGDVNLIR
jgi:gliding motility-associated-like protein